MELHILNVAPVDRYLHSNLQHNKLWKLSGIEIIVMSIMKTTVGYIALVNSSTIQYTLISLQLKLD